MDFKNGRMVGLQSAATAGPNAPHFGLCFWNNIIFVGNLGENKTALFQALSKDMSVHLNGWNNLGKKASMETRTQLEE